MKDPLFHFLVVGGLLFLVNSTLSKSNAPDADERTVIVDEAGLLQFIQFRSRAFNKQHFDDVLAEMSEDELQLPIEDYVREEIFYREAIALGLEEGDYIVP